MKRRILVMDRDMNGLYHLTNKSDRSSETEYDVFYPNKENPLESLINDYPHAVIAKSSNTKMSGLLEQCYWYMKSLPYYVLIVDQGDEIGPRNFMDISLVMGKHGDEPGILHIKDNEYPENYCLRESLHNKLWARDRLFRKEQKGSLSIGLIVNYLHSLSSKTTYSLPSLYLLELLIKEGEKSRDEALEKISSMHSESLETSRLFIALKEYMVFCNSHEPSSKFPISRAVKKSSLFLSHAYEKDNISMEIDDFSVHGNYTDIVGGIMSVLMNSYEAGRDGFEINISTTKEKDYGLLVISDNGRGMDEETLKQVYKSRFTTKTNHLGLGMTITKEIMETYKGKIEIESKVNEGTTVKLYFPVVK